MADSVDQNLLRRQLAMDKAASQQNPDDSGEEEDGFGSSPARALSRLKALSRAATAKSRGSDDLQKQLFDSQVRSVVVEAARKWALNRIKIAFGVTLVGLIVSYLIIAFQEIGHHWCGAQWIPELDIKQRAVFWIGLLLLIICVVGAILMISLAFTALSGPVVIAQYMGKVLADFFGGIFKK